MKYKVIDHFLLVSCFAIIFSPGNFLVIIQANKIDAFEISDKMFCSTWFILGKLKHTGQATNEVYYCMYSIKVRCRHRFSWEANCKQEGGIHGNPTSGRHTEAINI